MSKENINLPKTSFSMKANLPNKEPEILNYWETIDLYTKLKEKGKGKEKGENSKTKRAAKMKRLRSSGHVDDAVSILEDLYNF